MGTIPFFAGAWPSEGSRSESGSTLRAPRHSRARCVLAGVLLAGGAALAGCGTDVKDMLQEESATFWEDQMVLEQADARGLEHDLYRIEARKHEACSFLTEAMSQRVRAGGDSGFIESAWQDVRQLMVEVFPVARVERCAEAHDEYDAEIALLEQRLERQEANQAAPPVSATPIRLTASP